MTLLATESFASFERFTGTDTEGAATANAANQTAMFAKAGYVHQPINNSAGWVVRDDPLDPTQAVLSFALGGTAANGQYGSLWMPLPTRGDPVIIGFSVYVPTTFVPTTTQGVRLFSLGCSEKSSDLTARLAGYSELFSIYQNLGIARTNSGAAQQSPRTIKPGRLAYIETRISDSGVRVWMDDALVLDITSLSLLKGGLWFMFTRNSTGPAQLDGRFSLGHMYFLYEDARAPNVRLGPTTRVVPVKPSADVAVQFLRPSGTASNAAVVQQGIGPSEPTQTLQTEDVGARDQYAKDSNAAIADASLIHAIAIKATAANLEALPHTLRPWVRGGTTDAADEHLRELDFITVASGWTALAACTRENGTIFVCGSNLMIYYSNDGGTTWLTAYNGAGTTPINSIACGPDGTVIACTNGGQFITCNGTDGPTVWTVTTAPSGATPLQFIDVSPTGVWVCCTGTANQQNVKIGSAAWRLQARPIGYWVRWVDGMFRIAVTATSSAQSATGEDGSWTTITGANYNGNRLPMAKHRSDVYRIVSTPNPSTGNFIYSDKLVGNTWVGANISTHLAIPNLATRNMMDALTHPVTGETMIVGNGLVTLWPANSDVAQTIFIEGMSTTAVYGYMAVLPDGGFLIPEAAATGRVLMLRKRKAARPLTPLAGYTQHVNIVALNPATGLPWTNTEANAANVGMTVIS